MLRKFVCALAVLVLCASVGLAADKAAKAKKKGSSVKGIVKKIDDATGALTVTVKKKKETEDRAFKTDDTLKVIVFAGEDKKEFSGKGALKSAEVKEGDKITLRISKDGAVSEILVGAPPKKKKKDK